MRTRGVRTPLSVAVRGARALLAALLILAALGGCRPGYVRLSIEAAHDMNRGTPLYMLVRSVDRKVYLGESYSEVAARLSEPDPSVLRTQIVYPGRRYSVYVKHPKKGGVALYFLFSDPGGSWRLYLDEPLPYEVRAALRVNHVQEDSRR